MKQTTTITTTTTTSGTKRQRFSSTFGATRRSLECTRSLMLFVCLTQTTTVTLAFLLKPARGLCTSPFLRFRFPPFLRRSQNVDEHQQPPLSSPPPLQQQQPVADVKQLSTSTSSSFSNATSAFLSSETISDLLAEIHPKLSSSSSSTPTTITATTTTNLPLATSSSSSTPTGSKGHPQQSSSQAPPFCSETTASDAAAGSSLSSSSASEPSPRIRRKLSLGRNKLANIVSRTVCLTPEWNITVWEWDKPAAVVETYWQVEHQGLSLTKSTTTPEDVLLSINQTTSTNSSSNTTNASGSSSWKEKGRGADAKQQQPGKQQQQQQPQQHEKKLKRTPPPPTIPSQQRILDPFGLVTWPGSVVAVLELARYPHLIRDKRVLILGAGVGLEAQAAAQLGASHVLATDIHPTTLQLLKYGAEQAGWSSDVIEIAELDLTDHEHQPIPSSYDVIVVADVLYNDMLAAHIVKRIMEVRTRKVPMVEEGKSDNDDDDQTTVEYEKPPIILVSDSQRFAKTFCADLNAQFKACEEPIRTAWISRWLPSFTGSGVLIDADQTYDVKARILWVGLNDDMKRRVQ